MHRFIRHLRREAPGTRFTIGTKFVNIELAKMLDEQYDRMTPGA